ncbi:hypothetical protein PIB30_076694, partial [Stylosanthes scabra]|nr:hypothetical protein [Stylosanthes scabra]
EKICRMTFLAPLPHQVFTIADASIVSVVRIAENILLGIGELVIPTDFHVIKSTKGEKGGTPQESKGNESPGRKAKMRKTPRGSISDEKGTRNAPTQSKGEKKNISLNTEKKKKKKKEPDESNTQKKRALKCLSFDGLLGKLTVLKNVLRHNENIDTHLVKNNSKWR